MRQMIVGLLAAFGAVALMLQLIEYSRPGAIVREDLEVRVAAPAGQPDLQETARLALPGVLACLRRAGFTPRSGPGGRKPLPVLQIALSHPGDSAVSAVPGRDISIDIILCEDPRQDSVAVQSGNAVWLHDDFHPGGMGGPADVAPRVVRDVEAFISRHGLSARPEPANPRGI